MADPARARLEIRDLTVELGGRRILDGVSFDVEPGAFVALIGPNGSGKTTLLRAIYRALRPISGAIAIDGRRLDALDQKSLAQNVAVLRQETALAFDFTVLELVMMGRSPYKALLSPDLAEDHAIVEEALALCDVSTLRKRSFATLSGGEKQRVLLARALAQKPSLLLLDEPANHLDVRHQLELLTRVRALGTTAVAALHDLNLGSAFATKMVLLVEGRVLAKGMPEEVLTDERIRQAFGVDAERAVLPSGRTVYSFLLAL